MAEPTLRPDSDPMLPDGTGTPYLAIFNTSGQPIMDDKNGLPIGMLVTSFKYVYEEEKEKSPQSSETLL